MTNEEFRRFRAVFDSLGEEEKIRIRQKARWERCSLLAVFWDWPCLFGRDGVQLHKDLSA